MIIGENKNIINLIWTVFWIKIVNNPIDVIEQINYLIFIRDMDYKNSIQKEIIIQEVTRKPHDYIPR